jgi:hypothetical protein
VASDVGEEELEAVSRAGDRVGLVLRLAGLLLLLVGFGTRDLDGVGLELALKELGLLFAEIVLERERVELGSLQMATVLLGALDQRLYVLGLEQFDELVLRQLGPSVLSISPGEQQTY